MASPQARASRTSANADSCPHVTSRTQEKAHDTTTPTFIGYLLESFMQFSEAFEIFFKNDPIRSHPLGATLISQLRFFINQFHKMVEAQEKLLEELEATQKALAQKDKALERIIDSYGEGQVAMNQTTVASGLRNLGSNTRLGRLGERKILAQQQGYSEDGAPEWI
ncbi:hypothetical protein B0T10DRAFT_551193 [Thelonectria olida]|uniref:Uncharacterized protein n=1 Tax=Thelonectria olida TaxID=1576542 RepID=A0A9P8W0F5_9HYPO|nr:hypothetical protein B0T10DRAFT_551193 [Thelonectria olida]